MQKKYDLYLEDILESIEKIEKYTKEVNYAKFARDTLISDAVIRNLEIIGEAAGQVSDALKQKYPKIPWQKVKDFRNVVIHKYRTVDVDILWDIIENKLGALTKKAKEVLIQEKR